jgi:acetyl esterase/lipase
MKRMTNLSKISGLCLIGAILLISCAIKQPCGDAECTMTTYAYYEEGDCALRADVYSPKDEGSTPAILWLHPGGMITGGRDWLDLDQLGLYLEAGYTVVAIDHRLAPENKLETIVEDIEAAYTWLNSEGPDLFNIDPDRIAVIGHSAGGYLTLLTGFRVEPPPKALVAFYGYGDITGGWATQPSASHSQGEVISRDAAEKALQHSQRACVPTGSELEGRFDYYVYARQQGTWPLEVSGHDPVVEVGWFVNYEPVQNVTLDYPPTMLLHGKADTDVPISVAESMVEALEARGVAYEFISKPGWNHVFDQMEAGSPDVEVALLQVIAFLDEFVK